MLNTAERHVSVNPAKYPLHGISYFGFHVDDHPMANIARFFGRTTDFIDEALTRNGLIGKKNRNSSIAQEACLTVKQATCLTCLEHFCAKSYDKTILLCHIIQVE